MQGLEEYGRPAVQGLDDAYLGRGQDGSVTLVARTKTNGRCADDESNCGDFQLELRREGNMAETEELLSCTPRSVSGDDALNRTLIHSVESVASGKNMRGRNTLEMCSVDSELGSCRNRDNSDERVAEKGGEAGGKRKGNILNTSVAERGGVRWWRRASEEGTMQAGASSGKPLISPSMRNNDLIEMQVYEPGCSDLFPPSTADESTTDQSGTNDRFNRPQRIIGRGRINPSRSAYSFRDGKRERAGRNQGICQKGGMGGGPLGGSYNALYPYAEISSPFDVVDESSDEEDDVCLEIPDDRNEIGFCGEENKSVGHEQNRGDSGKCDLGKCKRAKINWNKCVGGKCECKKCDCFEGESGNLCEEGKCESLKYESRQCKSNRGRSNSLTNDKQMPITCENRLFRNDSVEKGMPSGMWCCEYGRCKGEIYECCSSTNLGSQSFGTCLGNELAKLSSVEDVMVPSQRSANQVVVLAEINYDAFR